MALLFAAFWLWSFPPKHTAPAPDAAKCTNAKDCVVQVDDAPEVLLSTIAAIGAVLLLIGVNGRRVTKFTAGGASFETAEDGRRAVEVVNEVSARDKVPSTSEPSMPPHVQLEDTGIAFSDELVAELARGDAYQSAVEAATEAGRPLSELELNAIGDAALDRAKGLVYEQEILSVLQRVAEDRHYRVVTGYHFPRPGGGTGTFDFALLRDDDRRVVGIEASLRPTQAQVHDFQHLMNELPPLVDELLVLCPVITPALAGTARDGDHLRVIEFTGAVDEENLAAAIDAAFSS